MFATSKIWLATIALVAGLAGSPASAAPRMMLVDPAMPYYRLGVHYNMLFGYGYQVNWVEGWSRAASMGLESGDILLAANGLRLTYPGALRDAINSAAQSNGWLTLTVRDVRTGFTVNRSVSLFNGPYYGGPYAAYGRR